MESYEPSAGLWTADEERLPVRRHSHAVAVVNAVDVERRSVGDWWTRDECLFVIGGYAERQASRRVFRYCMTTRWWENVTSMRMARFDHAAAGWFFM